MRDLPDPLFYGSDLSQALRNNLEQAKADIDGVPEKQFLHASDDEVAEHIFSKREVLPLSLHEDRMQMETHETKIDVRNDPMRAVFDKSRPCLVAGVRVVVSVPFDGDAGLWKCQPSRFTLNPPRAHVCAGRGDNGGHIEILWECPSDTVGDGAAIKREVESTLNRIRSYLDTIHKDVEAHNEQLRSHIRQYCAHRRQRLGKHTQIAKTLNIPLKRDPTAPALQPLPITRKLVKPLPSPTNRPAEPGIRDEDYEHILSVIRHEGRSFEATPRTFAKHDEEELRDIILAHLNGHYQGLATGESFRNSGKTDIRIEDQNRAAFIAECKVWRGVKEVGTALEQLLSYLTWRDCKAALIVFNKSIAGFTALQEKLNDAVKNHSNCESELPCNQRGEWRFRLHSAEDSDHKVLLQVFFFNLFCDKAGGEKT